MKSFKTVDNSIIDKIMGKSTELTIVVNSFDTYENKVNLNVALIYKFTKKELKNNTDLASLIFGRTNSYGVFKATSKVCEILNKHYIDNVIDIIMIDDIKTYTQENNYTNMGIAIEYYLIDKFNAKHGTEKQDKVLKQDLLLNGHYTQVKCSLATAETKGSFSTTNN